MTSDQATIDGFNQPTDYPTTRADKRHSDVERIKAMFRKHRTVTAKQFIQAGLINYMKRIPDLRGKGFRIVWNHNRDDSAWRMTYDPELEAPTFRPESVTENKR